jgi:two-component system nitrogen regulation sensor histidine kinase GlnL
VTAPALGPGFAETFAALPVAVLVIDPDGRIAHANAECEALLNHAETTMIGQPYDAVLSPPEGYVDRRDGHGFAASTSRSRRSAAPGSGSTLSRGSVADHPGWRIVTLHHAPQSRRVAQGADRSAGRAPRWGPRRCSRTRSRTRSRAFAAPPSCWRQRRARAGELTT